MEAELAEDRKATKNIMAAIEQGIFTATTKSRLLELEADIASLEQSIRDAKAISEGKLLEKERVVYFLTSLREGNLHSKTYQKRLIDTFVRAVYLWDDRIGIDYYYAGKDSMVKYSLSEIEADIGENIREVLKDSLTGHQEILEISTVSPLRYTMCHGGTVGTGKGKTQTQMHEFASCFFT